MTRNALGYALLTFAMASTLAFAALAVLASAPGGCGATCDTAHDFINSTAFVWWLGAAFVAMIATIPLLMPPRR